MYVRIARFEDVENNWDARITTIRERMTAAATGAADGPPIKRALMLVDRENRRGAGITFCETEDDLRKVDEYMNNMSPPGGSGTRSSVELFEVVLDSEHL